MALIGVFTMPHSRVNLKDIYEESNRLLLTKRPFFQNTNRIEGSHVDPMSRGGESRFFGYVYMFTGRELYVPYVFENGIAPVMYDMGSGAPPPNNNRICGKNYGIRLTSLSNRLSTCPDMSGSLLTHICYYQIPSDQPITNLAFLMDIRELGGIVHREPPVRYYDGEEIFDVVVTYPVSKSRIVGVIKYFPSSNTSQHSQQLKLYVNPNYTGGMEGAMAVAASFNGERFYGESEWEMVNA
ncbi:hypothetical protein [Endozoicomonas euniceicola]|uniref:Uncharacterized protein n=1 Tax=Endozoicomonas euniceicola TaxID=1234143 RepID=A0ABY6H0Q8_9GAMM|nr:hypothetical protein [Endozoicomonas euniceicola]UYM18640.1 hypothetical protein NX720_12300 [Endozoicomonas euniceicola]